jgi:hypothetical protein
MFVLFQILDLIIKMTQIEIVKNGDNYEIDIMPLRKILDTIYKLDNKVFNDATKRWIIPVKNGEEFEKMFNGITKVEVNDGQDERTAVLAYEFDYERKKIFISIKSFPKIYNALQPLFTYFKTIEGRYYDALNKKWKFDIAHDKKLKEGIKKVSEDNNIILMF